MMMYLARVNILEELFKRLLEIIGFEVAKKTLGDALGYFIMFIFMNLLLAGVLSLILNIINPSITKRLDESKSILKFYPLAIPVMTICLIRYLSEIGFL